jgi:hypothetical protein
LYPLIVVQNQILVVVVPSVFVVVAQVLETILYIIALDASYLGILDQIKINNQHRITYVLWPVVVAWWLVLTIQTNKNYS